MGVLFSFSPEPMHIRSNESTRLFLGGEQNCQTLTGALSEDLGVEEKAVFCFPRSVPLRFSHLGGSQSTPDGRSVYSLSAPIPGCWAGSSGEAWGPIQAALEGHGPTPSVHISAVLLSLPAHVFCA